MILQEDKHQLSHHLETIFPELKKIKKKNAFLKSSLYQKHKAEINAVLDGIEWDNTISDAQPKALLKILTWNIERGKKLAETIEFIKTSDILSSVDVFLAIETDNGMGRSGNRNVAKELAEALGMNYCFVPSYIVLGKGAQGETEHNEKNTLALHGTAILSKYKILEAYNVPVPPVKEVFHSSEKRLGCKSGVTAKIKVGDKTVALGAIHIDLSSSAQQRANQLEAIVDQLPEAEIQLVGGDWNTSTFNLKSMPKLLRQVLYKLVTIGFRKSVEHYMTPDEKFEKPLFDMLKNRGFDYHSYSDSAKGTIYYDLNDMLTNEKTKNHLPKFVQKELIRRLKPWNGCVPLRVDWLAGKNGNPINRMVIEKPQLNGTALSDHNPILVDLDLRSH